MEYKNISTTDLFVPNVGLVKAGAIVKTKVNINNPNFEKVVAEIKPAPAEKIIKEELKNNI